MSRGGHLVEKTGKPLGARPVQRSVWRAKRAQPRRSHHVESATCGGFPERSAADLSRNNCQLRVALLQNPLQFAYPDGFAKETVHAGLRATLPVFLEYSGREGNQPR